MLAGCSRERRGKPARAAPAPRKLAADWPAFVDSFIEARFKADPYFAVQAGRHEFDGQMPDWSRAALDAEVGELRNSPASCEVGSGLADARAALRARIPQWVVDSQLFWLAEAEAPFRNPAWYIERLDPSMYLTREYAPLPKRLEGFLGYARAVPALAANIRANLRTPLPRAFIERGAAGFGGYATFFRSEMPAIFAQVADEKLKRDLAEATAAAATAMDELDRWLESQRATATDDFALGAPSFSRCFARPNASTCRSRSSSWSGRKDLERNLAALKEACAAFAPKASLAACVDKMRANKPTGGTVEGARAQLAELRQFVHRQEARLHPEPGAGARGRVAAVQPRQLRLHQHSRAVRKPGREGDVLRRAARCEVERRRAQRLPSRQGLPAVRLGARSVAGPLPAVAVHERQPVACPRRCGGTIRSAKAGRTTPKK